MIGNMDRELKGHGDLIAAAALLAARGVAVDWVVLSEGPLRPRFEDQARREGVAEQVHFVGHRKDVPAVLEAVDLLVHPSWSEGFPNVVMEAMAARVPVVTTGIGGTHELVEDGVTGRLVPARAPAALADAVEWVVAHREEARAMAEAARRRLEGGYSLRRMVQRVDALYTRLVGGAAGAERSAVEARS
jgi:glycosyltransferase involved in cell wall biosynthesis